MHLSYFWSWLPMVAIAFLNATLRELLFVKHMRKLPAHQLSTITLMLLCSVYTWLIFPLLGVQNPSQSFLVGITWVILTVAFEFTLGRLTKKSWQEMFGNYDLLSGHIGCFSLFTFGIYIPLGTSDLFSCFLARRYRHDSTGSSRMPSGVVS